MMKQCFALCLRAVLGLAAGRLLRRMPKAEERLTVVASGLLCGCQVFCLLPWTATLIGMLILIPSFVLGLIFCIFLKECTANPFAVALLLHPLSLGMALAGGMVRLPLMLYCLPLGLLCDSRQWLAAPPMLAAGFFLGLWFCPAAGVCGMLLSVSSGFLLKSAPAASSLWVGGLAMGLMISAL